MDGSQMPAPPPPLLQRAATLAADFATRAAAHDRDASFAFENIAALGEAGLLDLIVPSALGGQGRGVADAAAVVGTIATGDASTALVLGMHYLQLAGVLRANRWPAHLRAKLARETVEGVALVNALRVEPELGTPLRGGVPATTATRVAEGWRISGRKLYSTGSPALRYGLVWARTADEAPLVGLFLLPMDLPGIRIEPTWDHMGMRASGSHDVVMDDVLLPADHAGDIRPPAEWAVRDPIQAVWSNIVIAALYDGVARAARDWLVTYLQHRKPSNLGAALATLPSFQLALGEIDALLLTNRTLIRTVADQADCDLDSVSATTAGLVKYTATSNAIAAVGRALEITGNPGLSRAHPLERHHRDVMCSRVHSPQNDMLLQAAGRAAFGL